MSTLAKALANWSFAEPKLSCLPLDSETENYVRRFVPKVIFSICKPTPLTQPRKLVAVSEDALRNILDMDPDIGQDPEFVDFVSGNKVLSGSIPLSHRYGGYQFGSWADQLGDGRAHLLGEYVNNNGERWELQLKGSGKTPYSRFGDGRAVLRSSVREFLCSEAMHYLGIPTSRAASLIVTDDPIPRDMFYDGNMKMEKAAVVLRLAPSWFRIGSLEILSRHGELKELKELVQFILKETFPHLVERNPNNFDDQILSLFQEITGDTAKMIAHWMSVGFTHGVMNTDNMSLKSVTIDYGPFGFLDEYDPHYIPNSSDDMGRYDLQNQPSIAFWNLEKLSIALSPLLEDSKKKHLNLILYQFEKIYQGHFVSLYRMKLGLKTEKDTEDMKMLALLMDCMERKFSDFTQTFRDLSEVSMEDLKSGNIPDSAWGLRRLKSDKNFKIFVEIYAKRFEEDSVGNDANRMQLMQNSNPRYILRNWIAQKAIEMAEKDDFSEVRKVLRVLKKPFEIQEAAEEAGYAQPPPGWSKTLKVSCSS